jgi:hypothetical protein
MAGWLVAPFHHGTTNHGPEEEEKMHWQATLITNPVY